MFIEKMKSLQGNLPKISSDMKKLKGHVKVELCHPRTGTTAKVLVDDYNVITNLYSHVIDCMTKTLMSPYSRGIPQQFLQLTPQQLSNGILLLAAPQNNLPTTLVPKGKITGYAGSEYSGNNLERGSLNHSLTGNIPGIGYQWVYEWSTERAGGLISSVGLVPEAVGNGNLIGGAVEGNNWLVADGNFIIDTPGYPFYSCLDDQGNYYLRDTRGYIKVHKRPVGYLETYASAFQETTYDLGPSWEVTGRPQLWKGHIWLVGAFVGEGGVGARYLLKIQKDTTNIVQQWLLGDQGISYPWPNVPFGLTNTHMHWVSPGEDRVRSFNLITNAHENIQPVLSYNGYGVNRRPVVWYNADDWACIMGESSTTTNSSNSYSNYADIIYSDLTIRSLGSSSSVQRSLLKMGDLPLGIRYHNGGIVRNFGWILPLFSVRNLTNPAEKDDTKTLKVTYRILYS